MTAKRDSGSWDDAYFDNIDLELRAGAVAPPPSTTPPAPPPPTGPLSPPLPPPVGGQSVDVGPFQGTVLVNGQPLVAGQQIGVNSTIDTTQGIVTLRAPDRQEDSRQRTSRAASSRSRSPERARQRSSRSRAETSASAALGGRQPNRRRRRSSGASGGTARVGSSRPAASPRRPSAARSG